MKGCRFYELDLEEDKGKLLFLRAFQIISNRPTKRVINLNISRNIVKRAEKGLQHLF